MKARKMWAGTGWQESSGVYLHHTHTPTGGVPVPVLVTSLEGAPFDVGDEVEASDGERGTIMALARDPVNSGQWAALMKVRWGIKAAYTDALTKIPREKTVTYTVTGEPDEVQRWEADNGIGARSYRVRVERVEEAPDE